jgi:hypothetical protein
MRKATRGDAHGTYERRGGESPTPFCFRQTSKVIKDRQSVEAAVDVPKVGWLTLFVVDSEGQYALRAFPEGGEAPSSIPLTNGEMPTAEHEPD